MKQLRQLGVFLIVMSLALTVLPQRELSAQEPPADHDPALSQAALDSHDPALSDSMLADHDPALRRRG